jgi:hypothetical protein
MGIVALLDSSSKKKKKSIHQQVFGLFRTNTIIMHMKEQHGKKWAEYLELK